jgi:hypothetical protein
MTSGLFFLSSRIEVRWLAHISSSATSKASSMCSASRHQVRPQGALSRPQADREIRPHGNLMKWREMLNADCPKRDAHSLHERCDVVCPDLPKVL